MYGRNSFELLKAEVLFDELFHDKFNAYVFPAFPGAGGSINDGILDAALTPKLIRQQHLQRYREIHLKERNSFQRY